MKLGEVLLSVLLVVSWTWPAGGLTEGEFLDDMEGKVRLLARHALFLQLAAEANDCGLSNCVDKCSRHSCSPTTKDNFTCVQAPRSIADCSDLLNNGTCLHLKVDFTGNGFVRVPPQFENFSNLSPELTRSICSQANLQFPASSETVFTELTFWNYFGSSEGVWRTYPGREADPYSGCVQYDPRKRPWYIVATSVVKDLVVLLDTGQNNETTFLLAKNVATELLGTMAPADRVNVVTFNSSAATSMQHTSVVVPHDGDLLSIFNISTVMNTVGSFSNITRGLTKAVATFNTTSQLKMIVVLTDGHFAMNAGFNNSALANVVSSLRSQGVVVFFFSLGPGDAGNPPDPLTALRSLSCQMNSSVTYVSLTDAQRNPLWAIRPYFDYQAVLRFKANTTFWTDIYEDFDGLGPIATVTYPVLSDGTLYGVAGIDVVVNSSDISNAIRERRVDANVPGDPLACQMQQVNLTKCTKEVDSDLQALCPQNVETNEKPLAVYLKNLCCDTCIFQESGKVNRLAIYLGSISGASLVIVLVSIIAVLAYKNRAIRASLREIQEDFSKASIATYLYTYRELKVATRRFHKDNKLGEGGFGEVYKGKIKDGSVVAVKKLSDHSKQGKREFLTEVMVISKVQHRNLVKLRGCCVEGPHRLLVYEYLEKKSLRQTLLDREGKMEKVQAQLSKLPHNKQMGTNGNMWVGYDLDDLIVNQQVTKCTIIPLQSGPKEAMEIDWPTRFNIATGTARGLAYLHDELQPRIIHRDIKASNILLDSNLDAKIADFGLAKLFPQEQSHFTTDVAGTLGYVAPEYVTRGILTEKADVYSYGVLLMEIVTGKVHMSRTLTGCLFFLVDEVRRLYKESQISNDETILLGAMDSRVENTLNKAEALRVFKLALLCTTDSPNSRPTMSDAILMLLGTQEIPEDLLKHLLMLEYTTHQSDAHTGPFGSNLEPWSEDDLTPPLLSERNSQTLTKSC